MNPIPSVSSTPSQAFIKIDYSGACKTALHAIYKNLTSPNSIPLKALKVSIGAPLYMVMTPLIITLLMLIAIFHLSAYPFLATKCSLFNYSKATLNELFSFLIVIFSYPVNLAKETPTRASRPPLLLVHGYMHNSSAWIYYQKGLKKEEIGPIYTLNLGSPFQSIHDYEKKIQEIAEKIRKETGFTELIIVAHSMGGVAALEYCAKHREQVKGFITLGTPFQGAPLAKIGIGQSAKEMIPHSPFIQEIEKHLKTLSIPSLHISSSCDVIVPFKSALPSLKSEQIAFIDSGHMALLYSRTVQTAILSFCQKHARQESKKIA